ncbi:hypothetical protein D3C75_810040 [compost metagenome]
MNVPANPSPVLTTLASFDRALGSILNVNEPLPLLLILMLSVSAVATVWLWANALPLVAYWSSI